MQTWDAIRSRRNIRTFSDRPIAGVDLDRILEAGRRAPSAVNSQPWDFVVVTARDRLKGLSAVREGTSHVADSAVTIALIAPLIDDRPRRDWLQFDLGQATMSMMLAAADLGIGAGHGWADDQERAREVLGFPADRFCAYLISFGYPADRPLAPIQRPNRRPFDEVVHRDRW